MAKPVPWPGTSPGADIVRPVQPAEFDSTLARMSPWSTFQTTPLAPGAAYTSQTYDVLTPIFQGRDHQNDVAQFATRGLGVPGQHGGRPGPLLEFCVPAILLDVLCFTRHLVSIEFQYVFKWDGAREASAYRWLPVVGGIAPADTPAPAHLRGVRIPAPWFRFVLRNEGATDLAETDMELFMWLRGG